MANAATSTRQTTPEFMSSETAGDLVAAILEMGVAAYRQQAAEDGQPTIREAAARAGDRAVAQLRAYHGGGA